jgi:hypothetical protein
MEIGVEFETCGRVRHTSRQPPTSARQASEDPGIHLSLDRQDVGGHGRHRPHEILVRAEGVVEREPVCGGRRQSGESPFEDRL